MSKGFLVATRDWVQSKIDKINRNMYTIELPSGSSAKEITEEGRYFCFGWVDNPEGTTSNGFVEVRIIPTSTLDKHYRTLYFIPWEKDIPEYFCRSTEGEWGEWESYALNRNITKNKIGDLTNLKGTTLENPYVCTSDGYVMAHVNSASHYCKVNVLDNNNALIGAITSLGSSLTNNTQLLFVKSGMKVYAEYDDIGSVGCNFKPLV